ncbi:MAG TPA: hypothetical protein VGG33_23650, partial [Polyangia bacterium]
MSPPDAPTPSAAPQGRPPETAAVSSLVVVSAVGDDATGAALKVAGLTLIERSARQLARQGHTIILAADPTRVPRPRQFFWPANAEIVEATKPAEVEALARTRGAARTLPANQVRIHTRDASGTVVVTDEPSRRRA